MHLATLPIELVENILIRLALFDDRGATLLSLACSCKYVADVLRDSEFLPRLLIATTGGVDAALARAARHGSNKAVGSLCDRFKASARARDVALRWACTADREDVVHLLLDRGADIHTGSDDPLRIALRIGHAGVARLLLDRGADHDTIYGVHSFTDFAGPEHHLESNVLQAVPRSDGEERAGASSFSSCPEEGFSRIFVRDDPFPTNTPKNIKVARPDVAIFDDVENMECTSAMINFSDASSSFSVSVRCDYCPKPRRLDKGGAWAETSVRIKPPPSSSSSSSVGRPAFVSDIAMEAIPAFQRALRVLRNIVHRDGVYARHVDRVMHAYRLGPQWVAARDAMFAALADAKKQVQFSTVTYLSGPTSTDKTPQVNALKLLSLQRVFPEYIPDKFREYEQEQEQERKQEKKEKKGKAPPQPPPPSHPPNNAPWALYKSFRPATSYLTSRSVPDVFVPPYPVA